MLGYASASSDGDNQVVVSGNLGVGGGGHPVTVVIEDEVNGQILEINNVKRALVMIEDNRLSSQGWLSLAIGEIEKINEVLGFLSRVTIDGLKRMVKR